MFEVTKFVAEIDRLGRLATYYYERGLFTMEHSAEEEIDALINWAERFCGVSISTGFCDSRYVKEIYGGGVCLYKCQGHI